MPVSRQNNHGKTTVKPHALNSLKKSVGKPGKRSVNKSTNPPSVSSGYSLYSSDSESGGVSSMNRGLDRCASLLANILDGGQSIDFSSKIPPSKKQRGTTSQPSKGKQMSKSLTKLPKQSAVKKTKPKPNATSTNPARDTAHKGVRKAAATSSCRPLKLNEHKHMPGRSIAQIQSPQFNDRIVSSTPNMRSPNSSQHLHPAKNATDGIADRQRSSLQNQDPSLEALAAQIRMLRSQAEVAESSKQEPGPSCGKNIPCPSGIGERLQQPPMLNTPVVRHGKINSENEPGHILRNLTDRLRDLNKKRIEVPNPVSSSALSKHEPHVWEHQSLSDEHQLHLQGPPELLCAQVARDVCQTEPYSPMPICQHNPHAQYEPPQSSNTSFMTEYNQLPDQNVDIIPSRERNFNEGMKETHTSSMIPYQYPHLGVQNEILVAQSHNNMAKQTKLPGADVLHPSQDPKRTRYVPSPQNSVVTKDLEMKSDNQKQSGVETISMGTQTRSPPADKGVQTSISSSPSSPDVRPGSDSESTEQPRMTILDAPLGTPHPQPKSSGKKSASWEQMRVLRYLFGELRAAIGELGGDKEVARLLGEVQESLDTLQYLPPDFEVEVGLALQPLRSENSQLRRRLRIANQQIRQSERRSNNVEPSVDVEVLTLQSLNAKLLKDLRAEESKQKRLEESNVDFKTVAESVKQKNRDLMILLQQKDNHQLQSRQEWLEEKSALTSQHNHVQSQLNDLQFKIEAANKENRILQLNLQQRDAEIIRLNKGMESDHFEHDHKAYGGDNNSISEVDDDDDETPKTSPHQSPIRASPHHAVTSPARDLLSYQYPKRLLKLNKLGSAQNHTNHDDSPQSWAKRVTFAGYASPRSPGITSTHTEACMNSEEDPESMSHLEQWIGEAQLPDALDSAEASGGSSNVNPAHALHSQTADTAYSLQKFLKHPSSSKDQNKTDGSDTNKPESTSEFPLRHTTSNQTYVYPPSHTASAQPSYNLSMPFYAQTNKSHNARFENGNVKRYENQAYSTWQPSQDAEFRCSALDGSVSGINSSSVGSESTQSSVTTQYEAQFQLGLASLDSEIAKLQKSLKSMGTC